ncbi:MAG: NAD(P)/FAD-dependent oxidoreductase [Burkholderiales bacterium]|nr:NAD(P)/FAD-dependent oxidoreductase [Burkholderiales bacterium]
MPAPAAPAASTEPVQTDALVIGAGPAGLFAVFQLGLLELHAELVDVLPAPGGQCAELYADKPLYDIPGLVETTGADLTERLLRQIEPFKPGLHLGQLVTDLRWDEKRRRFDVTTDGGRRFAARCVFIAAGVGAFLPRAIKLDGLERHLGRQAFHHLSQAREHPGALAGRQVVILGGEEPAVAAALALIDGVDAPASVTLIHRRDDFRAPAPLLQRLAQARAAGRLHVAIGQPQALLDAAPPCDDVPALAPLSAPDEASPSQPDAAPRLRALRLDPPDGGPIELPCDTLLILQGLSPRLGPIADWGLELERKQLAVDAATFATSQPGVHAVGDIVHYPGKKKLILSAFHEATLAAHAAAQWLDPSRPTHLEYTTSSPRLQRLLGRSGQAQG